MTENKTCTCCAKAPAKPKGPFASIITKPFYESLQDYKVLFVISMFTFTGLMIRQWWWFEQNHATMNESGAASFAALALACMGGCKWAMQNALRKHSTPEE
jgi:hypothetical protein